MLLRNPIGRSRSMSKPQPKAWSVIEGKKFLPIEESAKLLPSDTYVVRNTQGLGIHFLKSPLKTDELVEVDPATESILDEIERFWTKKDEYARYGMLWKRGILLWGTPGGGKTSIINQVAKKVIDKGGIVIYVDYANLIPDGLKALRAVEPDRPILLILEDLDDMLMEYEESTILNIIDGEAQIDNVIILATANKPEKLDKRVRNRPSRFDIVKRIGLPNSKARHTFLAKKVPDLEGEELDTWVKDTGGLSLAHLRDLVIGVKILGHPYQETVRRLLDMNEDEPCSDDPDDEEERPSFGFIPPCDGNKRQKVDTKKLDLEVRKRHNDQVRTPSITVTDD